MARQIKRKRLSLLLNITFFLLLLFNVSSEKFMRFDAKCDDYEAKWKIKLHDIIGTIIRDDSFLVASGVGAIGASQMICFDDSQVIDLRNRICDRHR